MHSSTNGPQPPERLTLKWIYEHMLWQGWTAVCGLLAFTFTVGWTIADLRTQTLPPKPIDWEHPARQAGWQPASECPNTPLSISITAPGGGTLIPSSAMRGLGTRIIIQASRPLANYESVGIVINQGDRENYLVQFPTVSYANSQRTRIVIGSDGIDRPSNPITGTPDNYRHMFDHMKLYAIVVSNKQAIGDQYSGIEQLAGLPETVVVSQPVLLKYQ